MKKETLKENLKRVFATEKETEKIHKSSREARRLLRESIEPFTVIYIADIDGKSYKITPDKYDILNVVIEEIEIL